MDRIRLTLLLLILLSVIILIASDETVGSIQRFGVMIIFLLSILLGLGLKLLVSRFTPAKAVSTIAGILLGAGTLIFLLVKWDDFLARHARAIHIMLLWIPVFLILTSSISLYYLPKRIESKKPG